ncbi:MAG: SH3 domain-containing protein [Saprospiraceae bacterium]
MATDQQPTPKTNAPRFEIALIFIFFVCFIMWSISRCGDKREEMRAEEIIENSEDLQTEESSTANVTSDAANTSATTTTTTSGAASTTSPVTTTPAVAPPKPKPQSSTAGTTLYVTIDNLNMRTHPHLDSVVVAKLPLFERVTFLNEVTEFKQEINLGKEMANEPWVKVQTKRGKDGWVYGAGVHYHKVAREGVQ